ncbi:hypothetical protein MLP_53530 [Microlunatus phosphovorus NM-1]|uniref:Uncharacterized protein n=1 Tax=Microlunatus phosphovorus (strain ATCC 700054 / DSM 10555 / JCM 9379 / NBRC 101784 / NCIMB 13414 / VKM Ac-1990 / NM-1) TaxID=1032480 RepID=F5XJU9_MICPN|nr:hypothetical protein MLP_53530 [Microlunatus phosphovorus NM-1]
MRSGAAAVELTVHDVMQITLDCTAFFEDSRHGSRLSSSLSVSGEGVAGDQGGVIRTKPPGDAPSAARPGSGTVGGEW